MHHPSRIQECHHGRPHRGGQALHITLHADGGATTHVGQAFKRLDPPFMVLITATPMFIHTNDIASLTVLIEDRGASDEAWQRLSTTVDPWGPNASPDVQPERFIAYNDHFVRVGPLTAILMSRRDGCGAAQEDPVARPTPACARCTSTLPSATTS